MATGCNTEYFIGAGKVYVAPRSASGVVGAFEELGDAQRLAIEISQDYTDIVESCTGNSNIAAHVLNSTEWNFSVDAMSFSKANLARALYGTATTVAGATVSAENLVFNAAGQSAFTSSPSVSAFSLKQGATTVAPADYTVDLATGVVTLLTTANLTGSAPYTLSAAYTYAGYDKVAAGATTGSDYTFKFIGINKVDKRPVVVTIHRVALNMTSAIEFIGSDAQVFTLEGMVLPQQTPASGDSQFVTIIKPTVA